MASVHFIFRALLRISLTTILCSGWLLAMETITGVVINRTTGKPAAHDDIAVLTVTQGALEVSRSRTAADGSFRLRTDVPGKHVLRVRHDGVIYHQEVGAGEVAIAVFDAASKLDSVRGTVTIMRVDSDGQQLNVTELHSIANESDPPRTLANAHNLEILLPSKAALDSVLVQGPSWYLEKVKPQPVAPGSHQLAVGYPLRPGKTECAIKYHLPYLLGMAVIRPRLQYATKLWTVVFPRSMKFQSLQRGGFHELMQQGGMQVEAINDARVGDVPGFVLAGTGSLASTPISAKISSGKTPALTPCQHKMQAAAAVHTDFLSPTRTVFAFLILAVTGILLGLRYARFGTLREKAGRR